MYMKFLDLTSRSYLRALRRLTFVAALAWIGVAPLPSIAQSGFQIVWVMVGEAATGGDSRAVRAGRRLFDAGDLTSLSLQNVRIVRVDVEPSVSEIRIGEQLCLSSLDMRAFDPDHELVPDAPLSVTVRQDHRENIGLKRSRKDICLRPVQAGEYTVRLTRLLPAPDGSMRGAQVFVRVKEATSGLVSRD
jgi:hypothetical protein